MNWKYSLTVFLLVFFGVPLFGVSSSPLAQKVLDKLYEANRNFLYLKPSLEITDETFAVASYWPRENSIKLEKKALEVCHSLGENAEAALAFIIGHELAHAYQKERRNFIDPTNYLSMGLTDVAHSKHHEREADIFGVFSAYLAGYKTIQVLPPLIKKLYEGYDISDKKLANYPSLGVRERTAREVRKKVEELINIFDIANYLSIIGEYELAASCYQHISESYRGPELLNNEGIAYVLHAMNLSKNNVDKYLYPLEIDSDTRLKRPKLLKGDRALSPTEERYRHAYLLKAMEKFKEAQLLDPNYYAADINIMCVYNLMGNRRKAIDYYYTNQSKFFIANNIQRKKADLALAIAKSKTSLNESKAIWERLSSDRNYGIAHQANYNLKETNGEWKGVSIPSSRCPTSFSVNRPIDNISLERINQPNFFFIDESKSLKLGIRKTTNTLVYQFSSPKRKFVIQRVVKGKFAFLKVDSSLKKIILSSTNSYYYCPEQRIVYLVDSNSQILEWSKFVRVF